MAKAKCAAHYQGEVLNLKLKKDCSLLETLRDNKVPIPFSCGGEGICTTCRIFVLEGELSNRTLIEKNRAEERGFESGERLSCQCRILSDFIEIKVP